MRTFVRTPNLGNACTSIFIEVHAFHIRSIVRTSDLGPNKAHLKCALYSGKYGSGCVIWWNWIGRIASQQCFRSHRVYSIAYCSSLLSLVMARWPDVVQRPCGSNSLPPSSIQGLILHILHKMAKHPPLFIQTWQGELNYMHQIFWSKLIYDKLALICHHPCFDTV